MYKNTIDKSGNMATRPRSASRKVSARIEELLRDRDGLLPVWVRAPNRGPEHYTGFTRPKLYELANAGKIRSVSIREPGQIRGCRLFNLASILHFIEEQASQQESVNRETRLPITEESSEFESETQGNILY